jgi:hypothetical protein
MMKISKSKYMAGLQCLKRLYLQVHEPGLAAQVDGAEEAIIQQGHDVGLLARELFPGGIEVDGTGGLDQAIRATKELVANPEVPAIFEGAFESQGVIVKTDILQRRKENLWRLVEVKSTTDLKERHLEDVAIQSYALSRSGLNLASVWLAHVNRKYELTEGTVDPRQFFLHAECRTCNPHSRFSFDHSSVFSLCPRFPISPRGRIAPIRLRASSFIIAINPRQTTTSGTCHGSTQAQRSNLRKWVLSQSTTYLMISS